MFTGFGIDPRALMWPVDVGFALCHNGFSFVRAKNIFRTQNQLPTCSHSASRRKNVIVTVSLVKFRSFNRWMIFVAVENHYAVANQFGSFRIHAVDENDTFHTSATSGQSINEVGFSIVVPKWRRIDQTFSSLHQQWFRPRTSRIGCFYHVNSKIRIGIINVKFVFMVANAGRPNTAAMLNFAEHIKRRLLRKCITNQVPVDQIARMQNGQARNTIKRRSCHVIIVAHANRIRIGIIGVQHRVGVGSVAIVGYPRFGKDIRGLC